MIFFPVVSRLLFLKSLNIKTVFWKKLYQVRQIEGGFSSAYVPLNASLLNKSFFLPPTCEILLENDCYENLHSD